MKETGLVPVFYHGDVEVAQQVVKACYNGGVRVFEFTNRGDYAHQVFTELNKWAEKECPEMIMGVGSIIDEATAALYISLGANFIVSPLIDDGTAKICNKRKIAWSPGCGSVSEIGKAHELGAEVVKIFPGSQVGGPGFVQAVRGPMPWTSIMPTGGVNPDEDNLKLWFDAGVHCIGMGSQLITSAFIQNEDYKNLAEFVNETIQIIKRVRS